MTEYFIIGLEAPGIGLRNLKFYNLIFGDNGQWGNHGALGGNANRQAGSPFDGGGSESIPMEAPFETRSNTIEYAKEKVRGSHSYAFHAVVETTNCLEAAAIGRLIAEDDVSDLRHFTTLENALDILQSGNWNLDGVDGADDDDRLIPSTPDFISKVYLDIDGREYHSREMVFGQSSMEDVAFVRKCRKVGESLMLSSLPGTGKSHLIGAAFPEHSLILGTSETSYRELFGGWESEDGSYIWVDGKITLAALEGKPCFIDECAVIDPKLLTGLYGVMDGRSTIEVDGRPASAGGGTIRAAEGFWLGFAYNPHVPGAIVSDALASRCIQIEFSTDYDLAIKLGVDTKVVKAAKEMYELMIDPSNQVSWSPQMRHLLKFRDFANDPDLGFEFALSKLVSDVPSTYSDYDQQVLIAQLETNVKIKVESLKI